MLGAFLSMMGPAPSGAERETFFLPSTAVYGRWCSQISGSKNKAERNPRISLGVGSWPAVFQCTWRERHDADTVFFLGASLAGYDWNQPKRVGEGWKNVLRQERFDLLLKWPAFQHDQKEEQWTLDWSPRRKEMKSEAEKNTNPDRKPIHLPNTTALVY